jgi:hypothetical protein
MDLQCLINGQGNGFEDRQRKSDGFGECLELWIFGNDNSIVCFLVKISQFSNKANKSNK